MKQNTFDFNHRINQFIDSNLPISSDQICERIIGFPTYYTEAFPVDYYSCNGTFDYLRLKTKELILKDLLLELTLLQDDNANQKVSLLNTYRYYHDSLDSNKEAVADTLHYYYRSLEADYSSFYINFDRIKSKVGSEKKNLIDERKRKLRDKVIKFNLSEQLDNRTGKYNLSDFYSQYHEDCADSFFQKNISTIYFEYLIDVGDTLGKDSVTAKDIYVLEHFAPYLAYISDNILVDSNIFTACKSKFWLLKEKKLTPSEVKKMKGQVEKKYSENLSLAVLLLHRIADIDVKGEQSQVYLCNEALLNKFLHYGFFSSQGDLFHYLLENVSVEELVTYCEKEQAFLNGKGAKPEKPYSLDESFFFLDVFRNCIRFDINLDDLDSFDDFKIPILPALSDESRLMEIVNMDSHLTSDAFTSSYAYKGHYYMIEKLHYVCSFLESVSARYGEILSEILNEVEWENFSDVDVLIQDVIDELELIKGRFHYTSLYCENQESADCISEEKEVKLECKNQKELHLLCVLLCASAFLQLPGI